MELKWRREEKKNSLCFATLTAKNGVIALAVEKTIASLLNHIKQIRRLKQCLWRTEC